MSLFTDYTLELVFIDFTLSLFIYFNKKPHKLHLTYGVTSYDIFI